MRHPLLLPALARSQCILAFYAESGLPPPCRHRPIWRTGRTCDCARSLPSCDSMSLSCDATWSASSALTISNLHAMAAILRTRFCLQYTAIRLEPNSLQHCAIGHQHSTSVCPAALRHLQNLYIVELHCRHLSMMYQARRQQT